MADETVRVVLGNRDAITVQRDDKGKETRDTLPSGKRATEFVYPADWSPMEALRTLCNPGGAWSYHASEGAKPAWVASSDPNVAQLVAAQFGGIEIRELEDENAEPKKGRSK